ncbi:hypothetical protein GQ44DRAFT_607935 [Phaeosphaeriaceae sp. PMI808]|nr:hypothetical protein GQ44DRAFT_607935 [Phaeosphaeriaceae sp. PMI808]
MGKELIIVNEDDRTTTNEASYLRQGHFRFMDLPAELRIRVYQYFLPYNLVISHDRGCSIDGKCNWNIHLTTKCGKPVLLSMGQRRVCQHGCRRKHKPRHWPKIQTQIFFVNKEVSNETRAVLYGSNTYTFTVDAQTHGTTSLRSPLIFGPLGRDVGLPLLRNLRSIRIHLELDEYRHWGAIRQRSRLEYFVDILKEHLEDESKKTLLHELQIAFYVTENPTGHVNSNLRSEWPNYPVLPDNMQKYMFSLESLTALHAIEKVKIIGVPDWFAQCLELSIRGKGGGVLESEWPLVQVRRTIPSKSIAKIRKNFWVTSKKWYNPALNWKEFAQRNDIDLPENIDEYWALQT